MALLIDTLEVGLLQDGTRLLDSHGYLLPPWNCEEGATNNRSKFRHEGKLQTLIQRLIANRVRPLVVMLVLLSPGCHKPHAPNPLGRNLVPGGSFETLEAGALPPQWRIENGAGAQIAITSDRPLRGKRSLRVTLGRNHIPPERPVVISLRLPQAKITGRDLVLAAVSNGSAEAVAQLDSPVNGRIPPTWGRLTDRFEIAHHVSNESKETTLSFRIFGTKGSWITIDDVSVRIVK
jgi:hypothetical protein